MSFNRAYLSKCPSTDHIFPNVLQPSISLQMSFNRAYLYKCPSTEHIFPNVLQPSISFQMSFNRAYLYKCPSTEHIFSKYFNRAYLPYVKGAWENSLSYADDMVLLSPTVTALQTHLEVCRAYSGLHDIVHNTTKTVWYAGPTKAITGSALNKSHTRK